MAVRSEREKSKMQERYQMILSQMLKEEDNKYCVDCDTKSPRWASWNIGVFICIRCAGFHRNLGVHISRVKSVNLDSWTGEQIASIQAMGNSRARAVYEANLPDGFRRPQADSALESFIRAKYEQRKWIAKEWIPPEITVPIDLIEGETNQRRGEITLENKRVEKNLSKLKPITIPIATTTTPPVQQTVQSPSTTRDIVENNTQNLLNLDEPLSISTNNSSLSTATAISSSDILDPLHELFIPPPQTKSQSNTDIPNLDKDLEKTFFSSSSAHNNGMLSNEKIMALFNTPQTSTGINIRPISIQSHNLSSPTFPYPPPAPPSQHSHFVPHQKSISFSNNLYRQASNFSNSNSTFTQEQLNTQFSQLMSFSNTKSNSSSDSIWQ